MKMDKILLIGFRASGKSSVGKELARKLGMKFVDLDEEIEKYAGRSIKDIVAEKGWDEFRRIEKELLERLSGQKGLIVALGGGAVLHQEVMEKLKKESFVIWLYAEPEDIVKRIRQDKKTSSQRPALTGFSLETEVKKVLSERLPLYEKFSHIKINTSFFSIEEVVQKALEAFKEEVVKCQRK